jgi:CRP-like cAMP-binding protein
LLRLFLNVASRSVFFSTFSPSEIEEIYDFFTPIHVPKGRVLLEQGMPSDRLFFVVKGFCDVIQNETSLAKLGPGQFVGEMGLVHHAKRTATVQAVSDCHLLECHNLVFVELIRRFPKLKQLLDELAEIRSPESNLDITDKIVVD